MKKVFVGLFLALFVMGAFAASLKIVSNSYYVSNGYLHLIGVVKHISQNNLEYVKIVYTLYDSDDNPVDANFTYTLKDILMPDEESPYEIMMKDVN